MYQTYVKIKEAPYKSLDNAGKPPSKLKTEYIIAIFGVAATILAALIGILPQIITSTSMPTATITLLPTLTVLPPSFTAIPSPTSTLSPSPLESKTDLPNSNLLYFVSADTSLSVLDTLSGYVRQQLFSVEYTRYIGAYNYSTISWLNDYEIAIYSKSTIQIIDLKLARVRNVTPKDNIDGPRISDLSSTGNMFYGTGLGSPVLLIQTMNKDGNLTSPIDVGFNMQGYTSPFCVRWSPNNSMLALNISDKTGAIANIPSLAILRFGQGEKPVIIHKNVDGCISWSPDGKYIVFGNGYPRNLYIQLHQDTQLAQGIYFIDIKSNAVSKLTDTNGYYPVWSADGKTIAFLTDQGISLIDIETKAEKQIYQGAVSALLWGR